MPIAALEAGVNQLELIQLEHEVQALEFEVQQPGISTLELASTTVVIWKASS